MSRGVRIPLNELEVGSRREVVLNGREFVVFNTGKGCVAYENRCLHQGGPVCSQGTLHPHLSAKIQEDGSVSEYYKEGATVLACPWHGWEYDLSTGQLLAQPSLALKAASVTLEEDTVIVQL